MFLCLKPLCSWQRPKHTRRGSWNHSGWKSLPGLSNPTISPALPRPPVLNPSRVGDSSQGRLLVLRIPADLEHSMGWDCCWPGPAHTQSSGASLVSSCLVTATGVPHHPFLQEPGGELLRVFNGKTWKRLCSEGRDGYGGWVTPNRAEDRGSPALGSEIRALHGILHLGKTL